ncbi:hypothetical protein [Actinacidiphila oryziradicis]|uniref:hypothetical protein n=1 Tax=Actinacidiphila oryziradicis TaxID=2571141 RepID=UPI001B80504B|nr:hypothetical protein [Actinacidiphila oryziradicis]
MSRSFSTVHRKAQDSARARLHEWAATGRIDGFALAYLGNVGRSTNWSKAARARSVSPWKAPAVMRGKSAEISAELRNRYPPQSADPPRLSTFAG